MNAALRPLGLLLLLLAAPWARATMAADLEFAQKLNATLALDLPLRDEAGRPVRLGDYFGATPVVLVFGYFRCRNLCSTVLDGVVEGLARAGLPAADYRLVAVSIDPRDDASTARDKAAAYRPLLGGGEAHFLTGAGTVTRRLATSAGFPYAWDETEGQYLHPAGFLVATPDGRIARYFLGVRFDPGELRLALAEAAAGRTGSLTQRLLLLCARFDPHTGRYSGAVVVAMRVLILATAAGLGFWLWHRRGGRAR